MRDRSVESELFMHLLKAFRVPSRNTIHMFVAVGIVIKVL